MSDFGSAGCLIHVLERRGRRLLIETIIVFAIGFLTAALLALLMIPGLSRRAERLARRRLEARLPTSASQISAERDLLRAELAVQARRVEMKEQNIAQEHAANLLELGKRDVEIASVSAELIGDFTKSLNFAGGACRSYRFNTQTLATLEDTSTSLSQTRHELAQREAALAALQRGAPNASGDR